MLVNRLKIELAQPRDAGEISELSHRYIERDLRRVYTPARIRRLIRHPAKNVVVARSGNRLLGFGVMTYGENSANLDLLAVRTSCRGQGVASRIVAWLGKVAATAGIAQLFVQVREKNTGAIRFYEKLDFRVIERVAGYYQGRETAVVMCHGIRSIIYEARTSDADAGYR